MTRLARSSHRRAPATLVAVTGVVALAAWLGYQAWDATRRDPGATARETEFQVEGLDCPVWCSVRLLDAIDGLDGAHVTAIDREQGRVVVRHDPARQPATSLRALLARHGFPVVDTGAQPGDSPPPVRTR